MNQVNGVGVQKSGDSCTVIQDGHCFDILTSLKHVIKFGLMRHSFFSKKPNVAIEGGWNKEENGFMVQLDLPCCIFEEIESEEIQTFLKMHAGHRQRL